MSIAELTGISNSGLTLRPVTIEEAAAIDTATLFESPPWLRAYGADELVMLSVEAAHGRPLLFNKRGRHLVHLGRLLWFEAASLVRAAEALFDQSDADFVVFEDIEVAGKFPAGFDSATFHYQRDWQIILNGPQAVEHATSGKSRSTTRRKQRAMERDIKGLRIAREAPTRDLLRTIVALNREKIESGNRKHRIDEAEFERLWSVVAETGHIIVMRDGERVIAGDAICVVGRHAYYMVSGYDMELSRYSPGVIVHYASIEDCRERGVVDFNMLWGDSVYKQRLGAKPHQLVTLVARRTPMVRFSPAYVRATSSYRWHDLKARVKPLVARQAEL